MLKSLRLLYKEKVGKNMYKVSGKYLFVFHPLYMAMLLGDHVIFQGILRLIMLIDKYLVFEIYF